MASTLVAHTVSKMDIPFDTTPAMIDFAIVNHSSPRCLAVKPSDTAGAANVFVMARTLGPWMYGRSSLMIDLSLEDVIIQ